MSKTMFQVSFECAKCGAKPPVLVEKLMTAFFDGEPPAGKSLTPSLIRLLSHLLNVYVYAMRNDAMRNDADQQLGQLLSEVIDAAANPDEPGYGNLSAINRQAVLTAVQMLRSMVRAA